MDFSQLSDEQLGIAKQIRDAAEAEGVDPDLALTFAFHTNRFNPSLMAGDQSGVGVFAAHPETADMYGVDPNDLRSSMRALRQAIELNGGPLQGIVALREGPNAPFLESGDRATLPPTLLETLKDINTSVPILPAEEAGAAQGAPAEEVSPPILQQDMKDIAVEGLGGAAAAALLRRAVPEERPSVPSTVGLERRIIRSQVELDDVTRQLARMAGIEPGGRVEPGFGVPAAQEPPMLTMSVEPSAEGRQFPVVQQNPFERAIQGAPDVPTGTVPRGTMTTFNTETERAAAAARGERNPFTERMWGATNLGLLAPPSATGDYEQQRAERQAASQAAFEQRMKLEQRRAKLEEALRLQKAEREALRARIPASSRVLRSGPMRSAIGKGAFGAMAGIGAGETAQYAEQGDIPKAATAGAGTLGALTLALPVSNPRAKLMGLTAIPGSIGGLKLIDYLRSKGLIPEAGWRGSVIAPPAEKP